MADQNVVIAQNTVTVSGGAQSIAVDVNFGSKGDDGNVILYGQGKPQNIPASSFPRTPQLEDWYINLDSTDDEYLYLYQYVYTNNIENWTRVFKIIPNSYQTNKIVNFSGGIGKASLSISNTTIPLVPQVAFPSTGSVITPVDNEVEMLAISSGPGSYAFRTDLAKYFYLKQTPASQIENWKGLVTINTHMNIENDKPVISSFQLSAPSIVTDPVSGSVNYLLPIVIYAYEMTMAGPLPIAGEKTVHIDINVI